jgi:DNA-binding response OmpR family regulator
MGAADARWMMVRFARPRRALDIDDSSSPHTAPERTIAAVNVLLSISDPRMSERIKRLLEGQRYIVAETARTHEVLATASRAGFDLVFVDAEIDPNGGAALCRRLREAGVQTPIIVLSATGSAAEAAQTIDAGADDVTSQSMATSELLARVRALRRRDMGLPSGRLEAGKLRLDVSRHAAVRGTEVVLLSAKEFELLEFFLRHQGEVLLREDIRRGVWPNERDYKSNIVDVYVHYLRKKIERDGETELIRAVPGAGYMLKA